MKKILVAFAVLFAFNSNAQETKNVVNDPNAEARSVGNFTGVQVSGGIVLYLSQGKTDAVAVSTEDKKDMERIITEVKNGVLKIYIEKGSWNGWNWKNKNIKAYVTVKTLESLSSSGACVVKIIDAMNCSSLKLDVSGASVLSGEINASTIRFDLSGASSVTLKGKTTNANVDVSGASVLRGFDLMIDVCRVEASGASSVSISVSKELRAEASGASSLRYKGEPSIKEVSSSGASSIKQN
jgi:Putative auto-transporter adhesin, head GIN domain